MHIKFGKYFINTDSFNIWITKNVKKKDTNEEYEERVSGYHRTFSDALNSMVRREVYNKDNIKSLEAAVKLLDDKMNECFKALGEKSEFIDKLLSERKKDEAKSEERKERMKTTRRGRPKKA